MKKTLLSHGAMIAFATSTLAFSPLALAHAHLTSSLPAAKAEISPAPQQITLNFTEDVEPAFSGVEVVDAQHKTIAGKISRDKARHNQLRVNFAQPLTQGAYQVNWHVLSVDGHKTNGNYTFTVK
ncbi:copper homeostasis periplasmic binding protein CopC [Pantoea stewartii]|uniref:copper homeostasis periplasmic binding protein CopC n=1 Tax=Pantoea stewartii TaxID=66269 RepID=UPI003367E022